MDFYHIIVKSNAATFILYCICVLETSLYAATRLQQLLVYSLWP